MEENQADVVYAPCTRINTDLGVQAAAARYIAEYSQGEPEVVSFHATG